MISKGSDFTAAGAARGLRLMRGTAGGHDVLVATTHLESPLGNHDMRSSERKSQLKQVHAATVCSSSLGRWKADLC